MIRICPLCHSESRLKYDVNGFTYYACSVCETLYLSLLPTRRKIAEYYKTHFTYPAGAQNKEKIKKRAKKIVHTLKALYPKGKNLLDVGSGYGYFVQEADSQGLRTIGIEPSKNISKQSSHILHTDFDSFYASNKKAKFDFITMIHVIEHVRNPRLFLMHALELLNKDGILYVETPNIHSHLYMWEKEKYTFLTPPDHIWLFSPSSFFNMLTQNLKIKLSTYSYPEHLMGIIKSLLKDKTNSRTNPCGIKKTHQTTHAHNVISSFKYFVFDCFLARLFYRFLNINHLGSIMELYIRK